MVTQPYFMTQKEWYTVDENDNYILTNKAPKKAIDDYNTRKAEYVAKIKKMSQEELIVFFENEDSWLSFPLD